MQHNLHFIFSLLYFTFCFLLLAAAVYDALVSSCSSLKFTSFVYFYNANLLFFCVYFSCASNCLFGITASTITSHRRSLLLQQADEFINLAYCYRFTTSQVNFVFTSNFVATSKTTNTQCQNVIDKHNAFRVKCVA